MSSPADENGWERAAAVARVREGDVLGVTCKGRRLALYKVDGEIFATDDVCTHAFALLSTGFMEGHEIECPLHGAKFDIRTGECVNNGYPAVETVPVRIVGDDVLVELPAVSQP